MFLFLSETADLGYLAAPAAHGEPRCRHTCEEGVSTALRTAGSTAAHEHRGHRAYRSWDTGLRHNERRQNRLWRGQNLGFCLRTPQDRAGDGAQRSFIFCNCQ